MESRHEDFLTQMIKPLFHKPEQQEQLLGQSRLHSDKYVKPNRVYQRAENPGKSLRVTPELLELTDGDVTIAAKIFDTSSRLITLVKSITDSAERKLVVSASYDVVSHPGPAAIRTEGRPVLTEWPKSILGGLPDARARLDHDLELYHGFVHGRHTLETSLSTTANKGVLVNLKTWEESIWDIAAQLQHISDKHALPAFSDSAKQKWYSKERPNPSLELTAVFPPELNPEVIKRVILDSYLN